MSAATANRDAKRSVGDVVEFAGGSNMHIYAGTLVQVDTDGYVRPATGASTSDHFAGVAWDEIDGTTNNSKVSAAAQGAVSGRVYRKGVFTFAGTATPSQTDIGEIALAADDQTVGTSALGNVRVGEIVGFSGSNYRVQIDKYVGALPGVSGFAFN